MGAGTPPVCCSKVHWYSLSPHRRWPLGAGLLALFLFLSTCQVTINGSDYPYATGVGEIQNGLPRWELIHRRGYPLYTATGSLFVKPLRDTGFELAAQNYHILWAPLQDRREVILTPSACLF